MLRFEIIVLTFISLVKNKILFNVVLKSLDVTKIGTNVGYKNDLYFPQKAERQEPFFGKFGKIFLLIKHICSKPLLT